MKDLLTTAEAARLVGVGVTSIKRWADKDLIRVSHTPGGHRRVHREDLLRFVASTQDSSREKSARQSESRPAAKTQGPATATDWASMLLQSDMHSIQAALLSARSRLGSWYSTADEACTGLNEIGKEWECGSIDIIQEHIASENLARALSSLAGAMPGQSPDKICVMACVPGETHTLGLSFLELCLREAHWTTVWVGGSTPLDELADAASSGKARMIAVSASAASNNRNLLGRVAHIVGSKCESAGGNLVMGGAGAWPDNPTHGYRFHSFTAFSSFLRAHR